jgi:serine acetyltransferase
VILPDTKRGSARMGYELHSNSYVVFGLFIPHRSIVVGQRVKAKWLDGRTSL